MWPQVAAACRTAGVAPSIIAAVIFAALFAEGATPEENPAAAVGTSLARWMGDRAVLVAGALGAAGGAALGAPMPANLMLAGLQQVCCASSYRQASLFFCGLC